MSESTSSGDLQPSSPRISPVAWLGALLGVVACFAGLVIFLAGCAGFGLAFKVSWLPLIAGGAGLLLTVVGGIIRRSGVENTNLLASLLVNVFGIVGGIFEWAFAHGSTIFITAHK
jgi:hypothetical protein